MEAQSNNSTGMNSENLSHHSGVILDIGTGDGRFVYRSAMANPNKFFIGIDANVKPLEKISMKATRKPNKGGLTNLLFVQAAIESLPEELNETADEIHIHFPWGSLLQAVILGEKNILTSLRQICAPDCLLEIIIGLDQERDKTEIERLCLPFLTGDYLESILIPKYESAGFSFLKKGKIDHGEWSKIETSWAKKLQGSANRQVTFLVFQAN